MTLVFDSEHKFCTASKGLIDAMRAEKTKTMFST